jgi:uncharacterized membrane protein YeaQ/YmgE (transglycosylase-associated protein family)
MVTWTGLVILVLIGAMCGTMGRAFGSATSGGFAVCVAVGFVGALLGLLVAHWLRFPELFLISVDDQPFAVLWAVIGAALFVVLLHVVSGKRTTRRRM